MVMHFVDVFGPRPPPCHLDARLTYQTTESVYLQLGLRTHVRYIGVLGGYQQSQQKITAKIGGKMY